MEEKGNNNNKTGRPIKSGDNSNSDNEYTKLYQNYIELKTKYAQDYEMFMTRQQQSIQSLSQLEKMYEEQMNKLIKENSEKDEQIVTLNEQALIKINEKDELIKSLNNQLNKEKENNINQYKQLHDEYDVLQQERQNDFNKFNNMLNEQQEGIKALREKYKREIDELKESKINDANHTSIQIKQLNDKADKAEEEINQLKYLLEISNKVEQKDKEEIHYLKQLNDEKNKQINVLKYEINERTKQVGDLDDTSKFLSDIISDGNEEFNKQMQDMKKLLKEKNEELERLRHFLDKRNTSDDVIKLRKLLNEKEEKSKSLNENDEKIIIESLSKILDKKEEEIVKLIKEKNEFVKIIKQKDKEIKNLKNLLEENNIGNDIITLNTLLKQKEEEIDTLNKFLDESENELIKSLRELIKQKDNDIKTLNKILNDEINNNKDIHLIKEKIEILEKRNKEWENKFLQKLINSSNYEKLEKEEKEKEPTILSLQTRIAVINDYVFVLKNEISKLKEKLKEKENECKINNKLLNVMKNLLDGFIEEYNKIHNEIDPTTFLINIKNNVDKLLGLLKEAINNLNKNNEININKLKFNKKVILFNIGTKSEQYEKELNKARFSFKLKESFISRQSLVTIIRITGEFERNFNHEIKDNRFNVAKLKNMVVKFLNELNETLIANKVKNIRLLNKYNNINEKLKNENNDKSNEQLKNEKDTLSIINNLINNVENKPIIGENTDQFNHVLNKVDDHIPCTEEQKRDIVKTYNEAKIEEEETSQVIIDELIREGENKKKLMLTVSGILVNIDFSKFGPNRNKTIGYNLITIGGQKIEQINTVQIFKINDKKDEEPIFIDINDHKNILTDYEDIHDSIFYANEDEKLQIFIEKKGILFNKFIKIAPEVKVLRGHTTSSKDKNVYSLDYSCFGKNKNDKIYVKNYYKDIYFKYNEPFNKNDFIMIYPEAYKCFSFNFDVAQPIKLMKKSKIINNNNNNEEYINIYEFDEDEINKETVKVFDENKEEKFIDIELSNTGKDKNKFFIYEDQKIIFNSQTVTCKVILKEAIDEERKEDIAPQFIQNEDVLKLLEIYFTPTFNDENNQKISFDENEINNNIENRIFKHPGFPIEKGVTNVPPKLIELPCYDIYTNERTSIDISTKGKDWNLNIYYKNYKNMVYVKYGNKFTPENRFKLH